MKRQLLCIHVLNATLFKWRLMRSASDLRYHFMHTVARPRSFPRLLSRRSAILRDGKAAPGSIPAYYPTSKMSGVCEATFDNHRIAYNTKTTYELVRGIAVFSVCQSKWFVEHAERLLSLSSKIMGEDEDAVRPVIDRLRAAGIGAILDYAAENDIEENEDNQVEIRSEEREGVVSARTYDYVGEQECDRNMDIILKCISVSAQQPDGVLAVKLTALGKPSLLQRISIILTAIREAWFKEFSINSDNCIGFEEFRKGLINLGVNMAEEEYRHLFSKFDTKKAGRIDYLDWTHTLKLEDMVTRKFFVRSGYNISALTRMGYSSGRFPLLSEEETGLVDNMVVRLDRIASCAREKGVRILVDAEQTYLQPAIDMFTRLMQKEHNKDYPVIYNTYQSYLRWCHAHLINDMERARREGYYFGCKLVRGAYMVLERKLANEKDYPDPIWSSIDETSSAFNQCLEAVISRRPRAHLLIASHNQQSIEHGIKLMLQYGINPADNTVMFAQLLGMADHLSFSLGNSGYHVFKYMPYGPVPLVIRYLLRRTQENHGIMSNASKEIAMMRSEVWRRLKLSIGLSSA